MDFINEGKTGKVKLYDIYEAIYEDCDSALADDFYKGLKPKMNQKKNIDLADAEVQLYIRDFLESHENDYQYDLLKQALEPYYDHEYDLADEDVQESYEVLEEDEYLDENATFEEIIYRMECAEIYEDLYNAAMLIVDPKLQNMVTQAIQQCEDDGDDVEEAYSIVTSDLLDMHINDKNEEFLTEDIDENKNSILSKVFTQYPDIDEEDEDYLNGLSYDELVNELKTRGWDDLLEESKLPNEKYIIKVKDNQDGYNYQGCGGRSLVRLSDEKVLDTFNTIEDAIEEIYGPYGYRRPNTIDIMKLKSNGEIEKVDFERPKKSRKIKKESEENPQEFDYRLLSRLKSDCDYYLGNGNRNAEHCLWAKNEDGQIAKMREIYNQLKEKPEWLSEEDINNYAKEMGVVDLPSTTNGTAEKEIQDMLDRSEKRSKENLDEGTYHNKVISKEDFIKAMEYAKSKCKNLDLDVRPREYQMHDGAQGIYLQLFKDNKFVKDYATGTQENLEDMKKAIDKQLNDLIASTKKEEFLDADINVNTGDISSNLDLGGLGALAGLVASEEEKESNDKLEEDTTIWSSEYDQDDEVVDQAYQDYLNNFEASPKTPSSFEDWLQDTFDLWLDAEADNYNKEHPGEIDKLSDQEIDAIDQELRDKVQKEIEANMDDLKDQYEEYCEEIQKEMTSPLDKEKWEIGFYEQDAQDQWEVKDQDFSDNIWPMIEAQCNEDILILLGSVGRWNGTFNGGKIIYADEKNLRNTMSDYDEVSVIADSDNVLYIDYIHHDGSDTMYLYTIPQDLTELAKAMGYDDPNELDTDIRQDYVDMEELSKHVDKLTPIIYKGGNE